jgi:hypothetical protein
MALWLPAFTVSVYDQIPLMFFFERKTDFETKKSGKIIFNKD